MARVRHIQLDPKPLFEEKSDLPRITRCNMIVKPNVINDITPGASQLGINYIWIEVYTSLLKHLLINELLTSSLREFLRLFSFSALMY